MPTFYTDGSGFAASKLGGCAYVRVLMDHRKILRSFYRAYSDTTTNRMELLAIIHALESLVRPAKVTIRTDSMYCVKVARYLAVNEIKPTHSNPDLWARYKRVARQHRITFEHVRGHRGDHFNEIADDLAGRGYRAAQAHADPASIADRREVDRPERKMPWSR